MGTYLTRSRAWVYIAFYDEYAGKHMNISAGLSLVFLIPMYWYGIHCNRVKELNLNMYYYAWRNIDKRNRLVHNMIMEHFEVHTEKLQDVFLDIKKDGTKALANLPQPKEQDHGPLTVNERAMIDEISGLTDYVEQIISANDFPEHIQDKMRSEVTYYTPDADKEKVRFQLSKKFKNAR
ncbi:unnamed protein product [Moneuplotes crassus]|uniref:Uncharacterized protein n=1 Tax=Euplotes crassus TaxID=5936 RepID=A0AAD1XYC2_EUPCR|nr:unnamed protein product [Moneuplotes crassus]